MLTLSRVHYVAAAEIYREAEAEALLTRHSHGVLKAGLHYSLPFQAKRLLLPRATCGDENCPIYSLMCTLWATNNLTARTVTDVR